MTVAMDLLHRPDGGFLVKAPGFAGWSYQQDTAEDLKVNAQKSLRRHMGKVIKFQWYGWDGGT